MIVANIDFAREKSRKKHFSKIESFSLTYVRKPISAYINEQKSIAFLFHVIKYN